MKADKPRFDVLADERRLLLACNVVLVLAKAAAAAPGRQARQLSY
jgi:hypothetical protein